MVKIVALIKRKPGMSREEFSHYWATVHGPLAVGPAGPPAVQRYTHTDWLLQPDGTPAPFDGVAEMWFDDRPGLQACLDHFLGEAGTPLRDDMAQFVDMDSVIMFVGEERIVKS